MKNSVITLLFLLCGFWVAAQEQTLFGDASRVGGFGGPIFEFGNVKGAYGTGTGGGGGVIVNDFFFGGYGMGGSYSDIELTTGRYKVSMGQGGLWIGYAPIGDKVIHPYVSARFGWGGITPDREDLIVDLEGDSDDIFLITPEAGLEINVFRWFRVAGMVGYRWVNGVSQPLTELTDDDFRQITGGLVLRFGGFGYGNGD